MAAADDTPLLADGNNRWMLLFAVAETKSTYLHICSHPIYIQNTALGTGGILYNNGNIISGPHDSLVNLLLPNKPEDLDKVRILLL